MDKQIERCLRDELHALRIRWAYLEIHRRGTCAVRFDVAFRGLPVPFGSVIREPDGEWRWMTPAWGSPGREPQAPPGHRHRFGFRKEGTALDVHSAMAALVESME
jgi:hypothetical protein